MTRRHTLGDSDGNVVVEFALILPVLMIILAGLADLGRGIVAYNDLAAAIRAGLEYAQVYPDDSNGIQAAVRGAAAGANPNVTTTNVCECSNGVAGACTTQCSDGTLPGTYLRIVATQAFLPMFPAFDFALGDTISATASVRTK